MKHPQTTTPQQLTDSLVWLRTVCAKNRLKIPDDQLELIGKYVRLLLEWNEKINLISRKDEENVWQSHILHSIAPMFQAEIPKNGRMVDLGTGGGLPGILLKILNPTIQITLIDSTQKKITAVDEMIKSLGLGAAAAVWGRAEELGMKKEFKGKFDIAVARGVGPLEELVRLAHPFLEAQPQLAGPPGSTKILTRCLLAYKGGDLEQEISKTKMNKTVRETEVRGLTGDGMDPDADKKLVIVHF